ncbi:MAG: hypothetical protein OCD76_02265 [Reichenbachiella sp.]
MSLRKFRNSTFKMIKDGSGHYIDPNHFMGHSSLDGEPQEISNGVLKHKKKPFKKGTTNSTND